MTNKNFDLTIVVPAFTEEKRIGSTLHNLADFIKKDDFIKNLTIEVIVVSANSNDRTHQIIDSMKNEFKNFIFVKPGAPMGKGRDVQSGILAANGNAVLFMDADQATPLSHIEEFYREYLSSNDVVIGTRKISSHHPSVLRRLISIFGNILFRIVGGLWITDSQCGFKLFSKKAANLCFHNLSIMGWGFDMEVLTIAHQNKLKIKTIQIDDWKDIPNGTFENRLFTNILTSLGDLFKILLKRIFRLYKFN